MGKRTAYASFHSSLSKPKWCSLWMCALSSHLLHSTVYNLSSSPACLLFSEGERQIVASSQATPTSQGANRTGVVSRGVSLPAPWWGLFVQSFDAHRFSESAGTWRPQGLMQKMRLSQMAHIPCYL